METRDPDTHVINNPPAATTFWRVEGSLVNLTAVRPVAFFTWNSQSFLERWVRRSAMGILAIGRPFFYAAHRGFATRALHSVLRGITRDRLDLLGEEYFHYHLKPRLKRRGLEKLREALAADPNLVLVSQGLDHVMRPLAEYLGVLRLVANRMEFRDGVATGRLLEPVIRPRGGLARLLDQGPDGRVPARVMCSRLGFADDNRLYQAIISAQRTNVVHDRPTVLFEARRAAQGGSVRDALRGRNVLLIGATGFIGKVFLSKLLTDVPDLGRVFLLIRARGNNSATRRFEKIIESSPVFDPLQQREGTAFEHYIGSRVEVVEGDVSEPGLGLRPEVAARLRRCVDVVINSSGLVDFNPDLRTALAVNVGGALEVLEFVRQSARATLLHISTCYTVGMRDGRIAERIVPNYAPAAPAGFDAAKEYESLQAMTRDIEERAETLTSAEMPDVGLRRNGDAAAEPPSARRLQKTRALWVRQQLVEAGMRRSRDLGWPNTYTFTKSLAESLLTARANGLPVTVVRPSIVETSTSDPFCGWNEGVNTSAPLSYLLGTFFRQLPTNARKRLDLIPVDLVVRGMLLIATALVERRHEAVYQLATSDRSPCDMARSIELTCLAHRKHYRAQEGLEHWLRARMETIPVSKARYQTLSAPRQKAILRAMQRSLPGNLKALARKERGLDRVEKLIELYEPFILYNEQVFEADHVMALSAGLPAGERDVFGYDPLIDWWHYWINIHIPALRKWSYPLIVGRPLETPVLRTFRMPESSVGAR